MLLINFAVLRWTNDYVIFEGISTTIYIIITHTYRAKESVKEEKYRDINTIHFSGGRNAEPVDYHSGLAREQSKVWEYLCRRSYYQQQQEQRRLELRDQKDYGSKDDPDRGFWTWLIA